MGWGGVGVKTQYISKMMRERERERKKKNEKKKMGVGWVGEQFYENVSLKHCF